MFWFLVIYNSGRHVLGPGSTFRQGIAPKLNINVQTIIYLNFIHLFFALGANIQHDGQLTAFSTVTTIEKQNNLTSQFSQNIPIHNHHYQNPDIPVNNYERTNPVALHSDYHKENPNYRYASFPEPFDQEHTEMSHQTRLNSSEHPIYDSLVTNIFTITELILNNPILLTHINEYFFNEEKTKSLAVEDTRTNHTEIIPVLNAEQSNNADIANTSLLSVSHNQPLKPVTKEHVNSNKHKHTNNLNEPASKLDKKQNHVDNIVVTDCVGISTNTKSSTDKVTSVVNGIVDPKLNLLKETTKDAISCRQSNESNETIHRLLLAFANKATDSSNDIVNLCDDDEDN